MADGAGGYEWVAGVAGALVTATGAAAVYLVNGLRKGRTTAAAAAHGLSAKERRDAIAEWRDLVARAEAQNERKDAVIAQLQVAIDAMRQAAGDCRSQVARAMTSIHFLYGLLRQFREKLRELGHDPGELPDLPDWGETDADMHAEFLAHQAKQSAALVREVDRAVPRAPGKGDQ